VQGCCAARYRLGAVVAMRVTHCVGGHCSHVLLDVRIAAQFDICSLPNSINIPLSDLERRLPQLLAAVADASASVADADSGGGVRASASASSATESHESPEGSDASCPGANHCRDE
jgi:hypothetical protein